VNEGPHVPGCDQRWYDTHGILGLPCRCEAFLRARQLVRLNAFRYAPAMCYEDIRLYLDRCEHGWAASVQRVRHRVRRAVRKEMAYGRH
jgi:hypothetical protein